MDSKHLWHGRFNEAPADSLMAFSASIGFDVRLWRDDIAGSLAHAAMLGESGVLGRADSEAIIAALHQVHGEFEAGSFTFVASDEDIHTAIERRVTEIAGAAGAKLHTARSRNDQVATALRLFAKRELADTARRVLALIDVLDRRADDAGDAYLPGYTHLQRAQPVYFAHHLLAYVEMLDRDLDRLAGCFDRVNVCPLGSGAIAGSTLPLDREFVARQLGFVDERGRARVSQNSMDAVSDRDFMVEFCAAAALLAAHLSRLAEDVILWASSEFNYIKIADAYTTGSSLMPQKKNPDIAELTRGKAGRVYGNLVALLTLLKGLPMTYNRDLQEDKERLFDTADTVRACVRLMAAMLRHTTVNAAACAAAAADSALLATDLADYLVRKGMPFRHAHHAVGAAVALAEERGKPLGDLTSAELKSVNAAFAEDAKDCFDLTKAMARRNLTGAPGTKEVAKQLARWRRQLA